MGFTDPPSSGLLMAQVSGGYHTLGYKKWTVFLHDAERAGAWVLGPPESEWAAERGLKTVRPPGSAAHTPSLATNYTGNGRGSPHPGHGNVQVRHSPLPAPPLSTFMGHTHISACAHCVSPPSSSDVSFVALPQHGESRIPGWLLSKLARDFWEGGREEVVHPYLPFIQWLNAELEGGYASLGYKKLTPFLEDCERAGALVLVPPGSEWAADRGLKTIRPPYHRGAGKSGQPRGGPPGPPGTVPRWLLDQLQSYLVTKPNLRQGVYAPYMPISYFLQQRAGGLEKLGFPSLGAFLQAAEAGGALRLAPSKSPNGSPVVRPVYAKPSASPAPAPPPSRAANNAATAAAAAAAWQQDVVDKLPLDLQEESLINLGFVTGSEDDGGALNLALGMSAFAAPGGARWI